MNFPKLALIGSYAILLLYLDYYVPDVVITPLLCLCFLMVVSLRWSVFSCLVAALVFTIAVDIALREAPFHHMIIRQLGFCVGASIAVLLCYYRNRDKENREMMEEIIHQIGLPLVVADLAGTVVCANPAALACVPESARPIIGQTFQDLFLSHLPPGQAMATFTDSFHHPADSLWELQICGTTALLPAFRKVIGRSRHRKLLVNFLPPPN